MSIFYTMDVQSTIITCKGDSLEAAKDAANEEIGKQIKLGNYADIDDFGLEVKPGLFLWNIHVKKRNYR